VMDELIPLPVGVPGYQIRGERAEGHEAAAGAERGTVAPAVRLVPGAVHAHALGRADLAVMDEHIGLPVGVPGHEVGGGRDEGHEATVGADRGTVAPAVALDPDALHADPLGRTGLPVMDEHVGLPVGVPGYQVGGGRDERDEATV